MLKLQLFQEDRLFPHQKLQLSLRYCEQVVINPKGQTRGLLNLHLRDQPERASAL